MTTVATSPRDLPQDPLQALRHATGALHEALDNTLPLARTGACLVDYALHLRALHGWLSAMALCLDRISAAWPCAPQRIELLLLDLRDMPAGQQSLSPAEEAPLEPKSDAFCWGVAYVVEGSSLGGQVLYRQLAPSLHPHPLRYLQGDGAATGVRWRAFMSALRARLATPGEVREACDGATLAFTEFSRHVSRDTTHRRAGST